jgi:hypothetical protein
MRTSRSGRCQGGVDQRCVPLEAALAKERGAQGRQQKKYIKGLPNMCPPAMLTRAAATTTTRATGGGHSPKRGSPRFGRESGRAALGTQRRGGGGRARAACEHKRPAMRQGRHGGDHGSQPRLAVGGGSSVRRVHHRLHRVSNRLRRPPARVAHFRVPVCYALDLVPNK